MSPGEPATLRVVTYNIHRCRGMDRRTRPDRAAAVLRDIDADVVALQEVMGAGPGSSSHIEEIGAALGMGWVMAPARRLRGHQFGNAVLSRLPDRPSRGARPLLENVRTAVPAARRHRGPRPTLHVYNVHLGTAILERRHQAQRLATIVSDRHVGGTEDRLGRFQRVDEGSDDDAAQPEG